MTVHETGKWESESKITPNDHPTPLLRALPQATQVPIADLGPLIEPVTAISTLTQASEALALNAVLAAISVAAQGHANVETLSDDAPLSLFLLSIADSGERKSAVDAKATKAIRDFEKPLLQKYMIDAARYEEAQTTKSHGKGWSFIEEDFDDQPWILLRPPVDPKKIFDDITYEGLVTHFENGRPSIGILSDEGGKIIGGYSMSPQNRLSFAASLSQLWDGKAINRSRAGSRSVSLPGRRTTLHLAVQPIVIDGLLGDEEIFAQGLPSRMLVAQPESLKGHRRFAEDDATLLRREEANQKLDVYHRRLTDLLKRELPFAGKDSLELAPRRLTLENSARRYLIDFYNVVEEQQVESGCLAGISGFASKAAEQACRIAGNLALFEDPEVDTVNAEQMKTAITIMQYFLDEALRIFGSAKVSPRVRDAEMLRKWLVEKYAEDLVDVRTCVRYGPGSLREAPKIRDLLKLLHEFGW